MGTGRQVEQVLVQDGHAGSHAPASPRPCPAFTASPFPQMPWFKGWQVERKEGNAAG